MFAVIGLIGALVLVAFIILDDVLDAALPDVDWISGPAIGALLAAFGLFGWVATAAFDAPRWAASLAGGAGGVALGAFALKLSRALHDGATDPTPTKEMLLGLEAKVVTPVRAGGTGEVMVRVAGQPMKLTATAADELAYGTAAVVIAVESATKVVVEPADRFWSR